MLLYHRITRIGHASLMVIFRKARVAHGQLLRIQAQGADLAVDIEQMPLGSLGVSAGDVVPSSDHDTGVKKEC